MVKGLADSASRIEPPALSWFRVWWPALAWAAFIFIMSTSPFSSEHTGWFFDPIIRWIAPWLTRRQVDLVHHYIRKSAHFTEYFVFCMLLFRSIRGTRRGWRWAWALEALLIAAGYAALDEVHQIFVPGRMASPYDSLLDTVGAFFALAVLYLWLRFRRVPSTAPAGAPADRD